MRVSSETALAVTALTRRQKAALSALYHAQDWETLRSATGIDNDADLHRWASDPIRHASLIREDAPPTICYRDARGRKRDLPIAKILAAVEAARAGGAVNVNKAAAAKLGVSVSTIARAKRAAREMSQSAS